VRDEAFEETCCLFFESGWIELFFIEGIDGFLPLGYILLLYVASSRGWRQWLGTDNGGVMKELVEIICWDGGVRFDDSLVIEDDIML
jgi:hypothetical protein